MSKSSESKNKDKSKVKCFYYSKEGHVKSKYFKRIKDEKNGKMTNSKDNNVSDNKQSESENNGSLMYLEVLCVSHSTYVSDEWFLDSGCSFHMSPNKNRFSYLKSIETGKFFMGNNEFCQIEGIGYVSIVMYDSVVRALSNVRYVPNFRRNLISLGALNAASYSYKVETILSGS